MVWLVNIPVIFMIWQALKNETHVYLVMFAGMIRYA